MANVDADRTPAAFAGEVERLYLLAAATQATPIAWFADLVGVSPRTVYRWTEGTHPIPEAVWLVVELLNPEPTRRPPDTEAVLASVRAVREAGIRASQRFVADLERIEDALVRSLGYDPAARSQFDDVRRRKWAN